MRAQGPQPGRKGGFRRVGPIGAIFNDADRETNLREKATLSAEEEGSGLGGKDDQNDLSRRIASGEFTSLSVTKVRILKPVRKFLANVPGPGATGGGPTARVPTVPALAAGSAVRPLDGVLAPSGVLPGARGHFR